MSQIHPSISQFETDHAPQNGCYEVVLGHLNYRGLFGQIYLEDPKAPVLGPNSAWAKRTAAGVGVHGEFKPVVDKERRLRESGVIDANNVSHHIIRVWEEIDYTLIPHVAGTPVKVIKGLVRACGTYGRELTKAIDQGEPIHFSLWGLCTVNDADGQIYTLTDIITWDFDAPTVTQERVNTLLLAHKVLDTVKALPGVV